MGPLQLRLARLRRDAPRERPPRRRHPGEDLLSDLIHGQTRDDAITSEEAVVVASLVSAGSETTALGACQMLRHLLTRPRALARPREDASLIPDAVRECLRFDFGSIAPVNLRFAREEIALRGAARIPARRVSHATTTVVGRSGRRQRRPGPEFAWPLPARALKTFAGPPKNERFRRVFAPWIDARTPRAQQDPARGDGWGTVVASILGPIAETFQGDLP